MYIDYVLHVLNFNILISIGVNECASNPCSSNATCYDRHTGYLCLCPAGYYGINCQEGINMPKLFWRCSFTLINMWKVNKRGYTENTVVLVFPLLIRSVYYRN